MKPLKNAIAYLFIWWVITGSSFAQQIINKVYDLPQKYKTPLENVDYFESNEVIPGVIWKVFSDRENNPTYLKPGGTEIMKTLHYLEKFYVIEDTREYLHLIKVSDVEETGLLYEDYGWIRKERLLLWNHCLLTVPGIEDKMAMLVNTIDYLVTLDTAGIMNSRSVTFYKDPELTMEMAENKGELYQIYFVYKYTGKSVLIGRKNRGSSDGSDMEEVILGWMPLSRIADWNHKIYLEPNTDKRAAKDRKNIITKVFLDKISAGLYKRRQVVQKEYVMWDRDPYDNRPIGDWYRFPLINVDKGIIEIGVLGEINTKKDSTGAIMTNVQVQPQYVTSLTPEVLDYLWQIDSSQTKLNAIYRANFQLYMHGYTTMEIVNQEFPMFKRSIIWNRLELAEFSKRYEMFENALTSGNKRTNIKNLWINLLKEKVGPELQKEFQDWTMEQINEKIYGLPVTGLSLKNIKLKELTNPALVTDEVFGNYEKHILDQQKEIKKILNRDEYEYSFKSNNTMYYWVLEDYLP